MGSNRRIKALGNTFLFLSILILSACGEDGGKEGNGNGKGHSVRHDSWQATSTGGGPSARGWHTTVWTGSEMIIWGGI